MFAFRPLVFLVTAALALAIGHVSASMSPPAAPSDLVWEGGLYGRPLQFWWHDNSDNEAGFKLLASAGGGPWEVQLVLPTDSTSAPTPAFTFEEWCDGIRARVVAFNEAGDSEPSNTVFLPPPPSYCPGTFQETFVNDTGGWAHSLAFQHHYGVQAVRLVQNAAGCPAPEVSADGVAWRVPCVPPGGSVVLEFDALSPILIDPVWEAVVPAFGDAQCDGDTDAVDALVVLRHVAGLRPLSGCGATAADADLDGDIDAVDAWVVLRAAAGLGLPAS